MLLLGLEALLHGSEIFKPPKKAENDTLGLYSEPISRYQEVPKYQTLE